MNRSVKALILALLTVTVAVVPILMYGAVSGDTYTGEQHTVVYHSYHEKPPINTKYNDDTGETTYTATYYGSVVSTEYNPQIWTVADKWYPIKGYSRDNTLVFAGWSYLEVGEGGSITCSDPMLPGDVMSANQIESATMGGRIHLYANWEPLNSYSTISRGPWDWREWDYEYTVNTTGSVDNGNIYTNILYNTHELSARGANSVLNDVGGPVTVRGGTIALGSGTLTLSHDTIMDSMNLTGSFTGSTHGDGNGGLYADGHTLVIGDNVWTGNGTASSGYPQLFGGADNGTVEGTKMIVHTGTYSNVISGSRGGEVIGNTYIVLRDVHVLDTLIGSSSGTGKVGGSAYVYATSLDMHGDYYEEVTLDPSYTGAGQHHNIKLTESTILTGGSNNGFVKETYVHISGDSVLWDVQGAGRRGQSEVDDTAHVDISGRAWVKHVVCGSITDGLDGSSGGVSGSNECVKNTSIVVGDSAKVGSVFGAGYDTYYKATYSSMYNGGSIEVTLEDDCTVGYVYGGGYRGTVGSTGGDGTGLSPLDSITININGGTVLGDVFGGGRGGVDKICHDTDGYNIWGESDNDSTGFSKVFVDEVVLNINGGTVLGSVYGGGESVPVLGTGYTHEDGVACMQAGTITINVLSDSIVEGAVYGGGKGVSEITGKPDIIVVDHQGGIARIPWLKNNPFYAAYDSNIYSGYAAVDSSFIYINILGAEIVGNVFGGGAFGTVNTLGIYMEVAEGSMIGGTVFGGGMGSISDEVLGEVNTDTIRIKVYGGATVDSGTRGYSLLGGGAYAYTDSDSVNITVSGDSTAIHGDIHAGGLGYELSDGTLPDIMDVCTRQVLVEGAAVSGSIYGGSRLGNDCPSKTMPDESDYGQAYILVTSGTVSQSIYGGGFQGRSYMDSHIYIGSPAFEHLGAAPPEEEYHDHVPLALVVYNIYGGGNLSGGEAYVQSLLEGDAEILIGGTFENGLAYRMGEEVFDAQNNHVMCLHGNIYGDGNYSTIGGTSKVTIEDYDQYGDHSIWSIQRADVVTISGSHLEIRGATDGGSTELSDIVTLNRIGSLILSGGAHLELRSQTSFIGSYLSSTDGSTPATRADCTYEDGVLSGNRLTIHDGRMFSVLGDKNMGYIDSNDNGYRDEGEEYTGIVNGFTILSVGDDNSYYGAYAVGSLGSDPSTAGFMVLSGDVLIDASVMDGDGTLNVTRTWYLVGHIEIGRTWTFEEGHDGTQEVWAVKDYVNIPRMGGAGTIFAYNGMANNPLALGTLLFVDPWKYKEFTSAPGFSAVDDIGGRMFFGMGLSGDIMAADSMLLASHVLIDDAWIRDSLSEYVVLGGEGIRLNFNAELLSFLYYGGADHLGLSGVIGGVTISIMEMVKYTYQAGDTVRTTYLPVNMVDVDITIYVEPRAATEGDEVQLATVVNVMEVQGGYAGSGHIVLPGVGSMVDYHVTMNSHDLTGITDSSVDLYADDHYLDQLGWVTTHYGTDPLNVIGGGQTAIDGEVFFGNGGIRPSVIRVDYAGGEVSGNTMNLHIRGSGEDSETTYHVRVTFQPAGSVNVTLRYIPVYDGVDSMKTLSFGGDGTSENPLTMAWSDTVGSISLPYGSSVASITMYCQGVEQTFLSIMNSSISLIGPDESSEEKFDYKLYFHGWYLDTGHTRQYNPSEALREDVVLYAGFGITVRFHGDGVAVVPQSVVIEPGTSLHDNGLYNVKDDIPGGLEGVKPYSGVGDERMGYGLMEFMKSGTGDTYLSWALMKDGGFVDMKFDQPLYSDFDGDSIIDLYLPWVAYRYDMTVTIADSSPEGSVINSVTVSGKDVVAESSVYVVGYDMPVVITFNHNVSEVVTDPDEGFVFSGLNSRNLEFTVPYLGDEGSPFKLEVTLVTGMTLTFTYVTDGDASRLSDTDEIGLNIVDVTENNPDYEFTLSNKYPSTTVTVSTDSYNRLWVTVPSGYHWALWCDDVLKTGGFGGRTDDPYSDLGTFIDDGSVRISVYKAVGVDSAVEGIIGTDRALQSVTVIGTELDGTGTYGVSLSWSNGIYTGDPLFEGYSLDVVITDGYAVFETAGLSGSSPSYTVLGTADVLLKCRVTVTWTLKVTFLEGSSPISLGVLVRNSTGTVLGVTADGDVTEYDLRGEADSFTDSTGTLSKTTASLIPDYVECSFGGFVQQDFSKNGDVVSVTMVMVEYQVLFDGYTVDDAVAWDVFMGGGVPTTDADTAVDSDGDKIWMDAAGTSIIDTLTVSMFDGNNSIQLKHLIPLDFSSAWIDGGPVLTVVDIVVVRESEVEAGKTIEIDLGDEFFQKDVGDDLSVTYADGVLSIHAEDSGTGSIVIETGQVTLILYILSDFDSITHYAQSMREAA